MTTAASFQAAKLRTILLDLFSEKFGVPLVLYDVRNDEEVVSAGSQKLFTPYCNLIRGTPLGYQLCQEDHKRRGKIAKDLQLSLCHAGLLNFSLAIKHGTKHVASILGGQMQADPSRRSTAVEHHRLTASKFAADSRFQERLRKSFNVGSDLRTKMSTSVIVGDLQTAFEWLYASGPLASDEQTDFLHFVREEGAEMVDRVRHEILIRFQPVLARAERIERLLSGGFEKGLGYQNILKCRELASLLMGDIKLLRNVSLNMGGIKYLGDYEFQAYQISQLVQEASSGYEQEASYKNVALVVDVEPCIIHVSKDHFICALTNLVDNAVKYSYFSTREQRRTVNIIGGRRWGSYQLKIQNYGIGILEEELERIWEDGYRGVEARDEHRTGSGVGCHMAREIIRKHGGRIEASSMKVSNDEGAPYLTTIVVTLLIRQS